MTVQEKGDLLIQVTAWAGLTVITIWAHFIWKEKCDTGDDTLSFTETQNDSHKPTSEIIIFQTSWKLINKHNNKSWKGEYCKNVIIKYQIQCL